MTRAYNINVNKNEKSLDQLVDKLESVHPDVLNVNIVSGEDATQFKLTKTGSGYSSARQTRKTSLSKLITDKLLSGESIGKSFTSSISEKTKARFVGMKEKFDPMNIARAMSGGSSLAPALLGRMMGRSKEDIEYFASQGKGPGKGRKKGSSSKVSNKDPFTTTIGPSRVLPLRRDDSVADITAKLYNLLQKTHDRKIKEQEIQKQMSIKKKNMDDARHKALMAAIASGSKPGGAGGPGGPGSDTEDDGTNWLGAAVGGWAAWKVWRGWRGLRNRIANKYGQKLADRIKSTSTKISDTRRGVKVGQGANANKAQSLRRTMSNRDIARLEKQGFKWDAATQRFKDVKTNKFVSAEKAAAATGKKVPGTTASKVTKASKTLEGAKGVLKFLKKIPILSTIAAGAIALKDITDAIEAKENGQMSDNELQKTVTGVVGGLLGGVAGAEIGAMIGSVVPVAGTLVGGVGGYFLGEAGGKYLAEKLFDYMSNNPDAEPKTTAQQIPEKQVTTDQSNSPEKQFVGATQKVKGSGVKQDIVVTPQGKAAQITTTPSTDQKMRISTAENNDMKLSALTETDYSDNSGVSVVNQATVNTVGKSNMKVAHTNVRNPEPSLKRSNYNSATVV